MATLIRTFGKLRAKGREWFQEKRWRQMRFFWLSGFCFGFTMGRIHRRVQTRKGEYGDHMIITEYYIDHKDVNEFETLWNDQAKLTQGCEGYLGTKLFKVLNRDWPTEDEMKKKANEAVKTSLVQIPHTTEAPMNVTGETRLPFQYLQLRGWLKPVAEEAWLRDEAVQKIVRKLHGLCEKVEITHYSTLANDKIKRLIF